MQSYRKISNPLSSYYPDGYPIVNQPITEKEKTGFLEKFEKVRSGAPDGTILEPFDGGIGKNMGGT